MSLDMADEEIYAVHDSAVAAPSDVESFGLEREVAANPAPAASHIRPSWQYALADAPPSSHSGDSLVTDVFDARKNRPVVPWNGIGSDGKENLLPPARPMLQKGAEIVAQVQALGPPRLASSLRIQPHFSPQQELQLLAANGGTHPTAAGEDDNAPQSSTPSVPGATGFPPAAPALPPHLGYVRAMMARELRDCCAPREWPPLPDLVDYFSTATPHPLPWMPLVQDTMGSQSSDDYTLEGDDNTGATGFAMVGRAAVPLRRQRDLEIKPPGRRAVPDPDLDYENSSEGDGDEEMSQCTGATGYAMAGRAAVPPPKRRRRDLVIKPGIIMFPAPRAVPDPDLDYGIVLKHGKSALPRDNPFRTTSYKGKLDYNKLVEDTKNAYDEACSLGDGSHGSVAWSALADFTQQQQGHFLFKETSVCGMEKWEQADDKSRIKKFLDDMYYLDHRSNV
jgi:hypothetical protein